VPRRYQQFYRKTRNALQLKKEFEIKVFKHQIDEYIQ